MSHLYEIRSIDPLVFGDGRPFSAEAGSQRAGGTVVPKPGVIAGSLRTCWGAKEGPPDWKAIQKDLLSKQVRGPILTLKEEPLFDAPSDLVLMKKGDQEVFVASRPSPLRAHEGSDLEALSLCQVQGDLQPTKSKPPRHLSLKEMVNWLAKEEPPAIKHEDRTPGPAQEARTHVGIDGATLSSRKGMLYETVGVHLAATLIAGERDERGFPKQVPAEFALLVGFDEDLGDRGVLHLGGERRVASYSRSQLEMGCPEEIRAALKGATKIRLTLATPAIFANGLTPAWTTPPNSNVELNLVGIACGRREQVSGWDYVARGPKPARWLVPAGATLFFDCVSGDPESLADRWLNPVSDEPQDRLDGYGLALWGVWK